MERVVMRDSQEGDGAGEDGHCMGKLAPLPLLTSSSLLDKRVREKRRQLPGHEEDIPERLRGAASIKITISAMMPPRIAVHKKRTNQLPGPIIAPSAAISFTSPAPMARMM